MRYAFLVVACLALQPLFATAVFAESCSATEACTEGAAESCRRPISFVADGQGVLPDALTGAILSSSSCPAYFVCPSPPYSQSFVVVCNGSPCSVDTYNESVTCDGQTTTCADCEPPFGSPNCLTW